MRIRSIARGICVCALTVASVYAATLAVTTTDDSGPGSLRNTIAAASNGDATGTTRSPFVAFGSLVPVRHSISKTQFCAGEPVTATMDSRSLDGTSDRINYVIGGVPGNQVALTYYKPGEYRVIFAASDGTGIDQQVTNVKVRDCGRSFDYVKVRAVPLAFENDTFFFVAGVESFGPVGKDNRSSRFLGSKGVAYEWDFGDGTRNTTHEPYVKHSYAERDERSSLNSTFMITVKAIATLSSGPSTPIARTTATLPSTPIGRTTVTLPNLYRANLNNGRIAPKTIPARAVALADGGYTADLPVRNLEPGVLDLLSVNVVPIACDGADTDGKTVDTASTFSNRRLPPGKGSLRITIPAGTTGSDICGMRYEANGQSADGRPVVLAAVVFVRDPKPRDIDATTPEYRGRVQVVAAAMRALGRVDAKGNLSGTITDAEVYELQLKGVLGSSGDPPPALPPGCAHCTPNQVCGVVGTTPVIVSPGHGTYAVKGDVAFLHNETGEITDLIKALGEYWTHTGIMVDPNRCRSDLMGGQAGTPLKNLVQSTKNTPVIAQLIGQAFCSVGNPAVGDLRISPAELYQGNPGVITQFMYDSSYFYPYGVTLAQAGSGAPRTTMQAAANTASGMSQRYGIYGYTDWTYAANQPGAYELSPKGIPNGHEGCSGFVMRALYNTAKTLPNFSLNTYSAVVRQNAAYAMYNGLYGDCTSTGVSGHIYQALKQTQLTDCQINKLQNSCNGVGSGIAQWTEGLLNQVINCFAFGDVGNGGSQVCTATNSTAWHSPGPGSGTISPQSVYNQMGTKYAATYRQEVLYPTVWVTANVAGCVNTIPEVLE